MSFTLKDSVQLREVILAHGASNWCPPLRRGASLQEVLNVELAWRTRLHGLRFGVH